MATNHQENTIMADDLPISQRRKRRLSSTLVDPPIPANTDDTHQIGGGSNAPPGGAKTPSKPKKKVRFSDPGPETSTSSSSTGLTPHLRRTRFELHSRDARDSSPPSRPEASRRLSLPTLLNTASLPSPLVSPSSMDPTPLSGEIQFVPLREVLEGRVKRRLRRNHLSEELNDIDLEKKSRAQCMHEIEDLRRQLEIAQRGGDGEGRDTIPNAARIEALVQEIAQLKQERAQSFNIEEVPAEPILRDASGIFVDDTAEDFVEGNVDEAGGLRDPTPGVEAPPPVNETATQASIPHPEQQMILRDARLSLEYLFPGEIALGLIPEDPKPLLDVMLERLKSLKAEALMAEDSASTIKTQESNLRTQFNALLLQLDRARRYSEKLSEKHASEKARADTVQARMPLLEISVNEASEKAEALQQEAHDKDRSIRKLQNALQGYRVEVGKLEDLINQQETEHEAAMSGLRSEMDEAVADLECHVAAETIGRREAEQEVAERDPRIQELQHREQELLTVVHEKQGVIREMEQAFTGDRHTREREFGHLNVQISSLSSSLEEANHQRTSAERACQILMRKLEDEKNAGLRAIDALRSEMAQFSRNAEGIKDAHVSDSRRRGAEVAEHKGLLTPVAETRFYDADIPGYVETRRGKGKRKQRPDSGIDILEEDEDEYMAGMI